MAWSTLVEADVVRGRRLMVEEFAEGPHEANKPAERFEKDATRA